MNIKALLLFLMLPCTPLFSLYYDEKSCLGWSSDEEPASPHMRMASEQAARNAQEQRKLRYKEEQKKRREQEELGRYKKK